MFLLRNADTQAERDLPKEIVSEGDEGDVIYNNMRGGEDDSAVSACNAARMLSNKT